MGEECWKGKEAAPEGTRIRRGLSASAGWSVSPQNSPASLLRLWESLEAAVASAELLALLLGGRAGRRGGASGPGGSEASGRGRAPESGGRCFPFPVRGGSWPLLRPESPPSPPLSKINRAFACRSGGSPRPGGEEPRARPRLPGPALASAPRTAQLVVASL